MIETIGEEPTPFERLAVHFDRLIEHEDPRNKDERRLSFGLNSSDLLIRKVRHTPGGSVSAYSVHYELPRPVLNEPKVAVDFAIGEDGLSWVEIPTLGFRVGEATLNTIPTVRLARFAKVEKETAARVLADWVDKVIEDKQYSPPPFSVTLPTNP